MMFKLYAVVVLITSTAGEVAKYFDEHVYVHVCLSLCVSVSVCPLEYLPYYTRDLYLIFVRVAYGCGSVLLRRGDEIPRNGQYWGFITLALGTHTKTAEQIKMPFGLMTRMGPRNHVLHGVQILRGAWAIFGVIRVTQKNWQSSL